MRPSNAFKLAMMNAILLAGCSSNKDLPQTKPPQRPEGPETYITLPNNSSKIPIDADFLAANGQKTVRYVAQYDTDFTPFLKVPSKDKMANESPELHQTIQEYADYLMRDLRFKVQDLRPTEAENVVFAIAYLIVNGSMSEEKIKAVINADFDERSPNNESGDLIRQLNLVVNHPDKTLAEMVQEIERHLYSHFEDNPAHLARVKAGYIKVTEQMQEIRTNTPG